MSAPLHEPGPMIRVSVPYLISASHRLDAIAKLSTASVKLQQIQAVLSNVEATLVGLYGTDSLYKSHLRVSFVPARILYEKVRSINARQGPEAEVTEQEIVEMKALHTQFSHVISSDFEALDVYLITQKEPYNIFSLLTGGEKLFPDDLVIKVPDALFDAQQAAKCLAFELPTACGFHVFRVMESVLRRYYDVATGGKAPPKVRNIAVYINAMTQAGRGNSKILAALKQVSDLHRNPLIHPDAVLTMDEALAVIGIARSATTLMLREIPPPPLTTTTASIGSP